MKLATTAFVLTFVALIVFSVLGASTMREAAEQTLAADSLNHEYERVERDLWKEASLARSKGIDPAHSDFYANLGAERLAADSIDSSLDTIMITGSSGDRHEAERVSLEYSRYTDVLRTLFAEIDASSSETARTYEKSVRLFDLMQRQINLRAHEQQDAAVSALLRLEKTQKYVVRTIFIGAILGSALLGASGVMILKYRRTIEEAHRTEYAQLATVSLTDTLTGLGNHRAYNEDLERLLAQAARQKGQVTLALIDVDEFKLVNDTKGHIYGDEVLAGLAVLITGCRKNDRGYRLGGDEFAILCSDDTAEAMVGMERLRHDVATTLEGVTISIGLSTVRGSLLDARGLRAEADAALYATKRSGRNAVIAYEGTRSPVAVDGHRKESVVFSSVAGVEQKLQAG